jgi:hypothetical protein
MFKRAVVLDIITHPGLLSDNIVKKLINSDSIFRLANNKKLEFLKTLPANSIIGSFVDNKNVFIALPFFSSHMSLPLKVQEEVWIYEDVSASKDFENEYYWVSRVHGNNFYEDPNYTHADRKYLKNYDKNKERDTLNIENADFVSVALFNNGPILGKNSDAKAGDISLEARDKKIKKSLNLSSQHLLEDVPRTFKNPGDYIIQGSNNTLIRLGTNHIRKSQNTFKDIYNNTIFFKQPESYSGTIDIVAGRASLSQGLGIEKKPITYRKDENDLFLKNIVTRAYKNSQLVIYNENERTENLKDTEYYLGNQNFNWAEGDPDFFTDISRLMVSEYLNGDELLNYPTLYSITTDGVQENLSNNKKRGYIIAKSDEIRLIARANVITKQHTDTDQLEYSNQIENSGSIRLIKEGENLDDQAYIVINENGHISVDGPTIVLGDKKRIKDNGAGDSIYLGNNSHEPGVLGYMLKNKLENFMNETIRALNIIGLCLKNLDSHVHQYSGPAGLTLYPTKGPAPSQNLDGFTNNQFSLSTYEYSNVNTNTLDLDALAADNPDNKTGNYGKVKDITNSQKLEDKIKDIATIRDSLNDILSKFVKTL